MASWHGDVDVSAANFMSNKQGIAFVILSMAAFTLEDMFIKLLSIHLPVGQLLCMFGLGTASLFAAIMLAGRVRFDEPGAWSRVPLLRVFCEAGAALTFYLALSKIDLTLVAAIYQAVPLVIVIGASIFLREQVGWRRWCTVLLGLAGVMFVIRPSFAEFDPNSLWALLSVILVAGRDLATRRIPKTLSSTLISFQGFAILVPTGLLWHLSMGEAFAPISPSYVAMTFGGIVFGAIGYYCIVRGMRLGEASVVAPFRYSRILFAMLIGVIVLGERVDATTLFGVCLIILAGIYSFERDVGKTDCAKL